MVANKANVPIGRMECGAIKSSSEVKVLEVEKEIGKEEQKDVNMSAEDLASTHFMTLRKMALAKGYEGIDLSRPALIEFLNANNKTI